MPKKNQSRLGGKQTRGPTTKKRNIVRRTPNIFLVPEKDKKTMRRGAESKTLRRALIDTTRGRRTNIKKTRKKK